MLRLRHPIATRRAAGKSSRYTVGRRTLVAVTLLAGYSLGAGAPASAQVLFQPMAATTNMGATSSNINNTRDQSGLSVGYTSGVTPLAGYDATHGGRLNDIWRSAPDNPTGFVTYDLGVARDIGTFVLWNDAPFINSRITSFSLSASNVADFSTGVTNLGSFLTNTTGDSTAINLEAFSFEATTARYFRLNITSNGGSTNTVFGEAAFASPAASTRIPEPSSLVLLSLSMGIPILMGRIGIVARQRKA